MSEFQSICEPELRSIEGGSVAGGESGIGAVLALGLCIVVAAVGGTGTLRGLNPEVTKKGTGAK
jgi:hypothetical protein